MTHNFCLDADDIRTLVIKTAILVVVFRGSVSKNIKFKD